MKLEDKIFYRAIIGIHFVFVLFLFFGCYAQSYLLWHFFPVAFIFSLIIRESLIYIAYGKNALLEKWKKTFDFIKRVVNHGQQSGDS